jgi:hypothetical protein
MSKNSSNNKNFTMDTLQKYKDQPLYEVPEHYFEQLQYDVMQLVKKEEKQQKATKKWISAVSVAASIAIIITLSFFLFVNRNTTEHFYVHEEITNHEDTILTLDSSHYAEATEIIINNTVVSEEITKPLSTKAPLVAQKETIVYRAVDYYLDDYDINNFCEVMCDLECFYDY